MSFKNTKLNDPTYESIEIKSNIVWHIAFILSEFYNDSAPIGWSKYIDAAESLKNNFNITNK